MSVTVILRGPITAHIESLQYNIQINGNALLDDVLHRLIEEVAEIQRFWSTPDLIDRNALVLLNERDIGLTGGLTSEVNDGDVVVILPLIHGG